jgi:hypothetical protein
VTYGLTINLTADKLAYHEYLPITEVFSVDNPYDNWVYSFKKFLTGFIWDRNKFLEKYIWNTSSVTTKRWLHFVIPLSAIYSSLFVFPIVGMARSQVICIKYDVPHQIYLSHLLLGCLS